MAKEPDHAGSGLDKPPPKTIAEKIGDALLECGRAVSVKGPIIKVRRDMGYR